MAKRPPENDVERHKICNSRDCKCRAAIEPASYAGAFRKTIPEPRSLKRTPTFGVIPVLLNLAFNQFGKYPDDEPNGETADHAANEQIEQDNGGPLLAILS
jgi:hypothetical protein